MDRPRLPGQSGFSLIELLTVVLIIGVLALIAIPQFSAQRKRGFEATLKADLRNAAAAEEAYFAQHQVYKAGPLPNVTLPGYSKSAGISEMDAAVGTNTYLLTATHSNCVGIAWTYTNGTGLASGPPCP
jgi:prepilin-type N-terminal cleavage/methylation domain-containing protein